MHPLSCLGRESRIDRRLVRRRCGKIGEMKMEHNRRRAAGRIAEPVDITRHVRFSLMVPGHAENDMSDLYSSLDAVRTL